jgi:hypothetical protein
MLLNRHRSASRLLCTIAQLRGRSRMLPSWSCRAVPERAGPAALASRVCPVDDGAVAMCSRAVTALRLVVLTAAAVFCGAFLGATPFSSKGLSS